MNNYESKQEFGDFLKMSNQMIDEQSEEYRLIEIQQRSNPGYSESKKESHVEHQLLLAPPKI